MQLPKSLSRVSELAEGFRSDDWRNSLPLWVSAGLVLLLAWQLVQLLWTALSAGPAAAIVPPGDARPATPAGPPIDIQAIVNAHLFGMPGASELDPSAAPATQMSLVLVGTIAQTDPEKGLAILGESAPTAKVYGVGKTVTGGARLHSVYPDRVILDRGGKLEALMLPKKFQGGGARPQATMAAPMRNPEPYWATRSAPSPPRTRRRSPRSSGPSRCSPMASSAATASIPAATGSSSPSSA